MKNFLNMWPTPFSLFSASEGRGQSAANRNRTRYFACAHWNTTSQEWQDESSPGLQESLEKPQIITFHELEAAREVGLNPTVNVLEAVG